MQEARPNATGLVGVGDVVATKYRIDKVLGIGGMGMVALATHLELDQQVALKFMLPEAMGSPTAIDRFLREARAAVRLRSEHVCRVLDVGRLEGGAPYIVMEYMVGEDFSNLVERGQMPIRDVVDYTLQILEGIADAHANGIVHRDLKPSNVFITSDTDGSPLLKVLDFGISKSSVDMGATKTGDIMGSPSYMAPEQMSSAKHVDARADIWALGCILYESLTGGVPFTGDTLPALCMAVMTEEPAPVQSRRADIPPPLAAAVMRCLEKKPDARFATVAELARAIAPFGAHDANTVAERIGKVLGRTTSPRGAASSNPELAGTVAAPSKPPEAAPNAIATKPGKVAPRNAPGTLTGTASELVTSTQSTRSRRSPLLIGGIVVAAGASAALVVMMSRRDTPTPPSASNTATTTGPAIETPLVAGSGSAAAPSEAPVDPKLAAARQHLSTVVAAFVRWSSAHPTSPCPTASDLASFVAAGIQDPWHHAVSITCTEQPEDQMMGAVSLGPDGMRSADDIASWQLGETVTGLVRGPRWAPAAGSATSPTTTSTRTRTRPTGTSSATTHATATSPPPGTTSTTSPATSTTTSSPPTNAGSATKPTTGAGFGSDGLPIGRTTR